MRKSIIAALCAASVLPLMAAESVPFTWFYMNAKKNASGKAPITEAAPQKAECSPDTKYGIYMLVDVPKVEDGAIYRLIMMPRTKKPQNICERVQHTEKEPWEIGSSTKYGPHTYYMIGKKDAKNRWAISFDGKYDFELTQLAVEKLTPEEVKTNLVYKDGLLPGLWPEIWWKDGMKDKFLPPVLKKEATSPNGSYLSFPAQEKGTGFPSLQAVPFIPNKDYEIKIWLRGNGKGQFHMQLLDATGSTKFGFKPEWTEYTLTGKTKDKWSWGGPIFMIVSHTVAIPAFDMGGISFRYLDK